MLPGGPIETKPCASEKKLLNREFSKTEEQVAIRPNYDSLDLLKIL